MPRIKSVSLIVLVLSLAAVGQVAVSPSPDVHMQFFDASGKPLSNGFLYSYVAGTTTPLDTYIDSTGTIKNPNPTPLDSTGAPSNGSVQTGIWLSNSAYKFCAYSSALVQQWCTDNVTGYLNLLNLANFWTQPQTFTVPLTVSALNNQLVFGADGAQTTFDFPIPVSDVVIHAPSTSTVLMGRDTVDVMTNKSSTSEQLTAPIVNGTTIIDSPGTYITLQNEGSVGTANVTLTKMVNSPAQARIAAPSDTGIIGITVSNPGITGNATIQESGTSFCQFDGTTTGGDYVTVSATNAGFCHDAGSAYPTTGQAIGRVVNGGAAGPQVMMLFGPEIRGARTSPNITSAIAGTGAGTTPTITCTNCQDNGGTVVVTTGSGSPATSATIVTITFAGTYTAAHCVISEANSATSALAVGARAIGLTTTGPPAFMNITSGGTGLSTTTQYSWTYVCSFVN